MPFCVAFFESTVDALVALISAAMTLVASLVHPIPGQPQVISASSAIALVSYVAGQDVSDPVARLRDADPRVRAVAACDLQRLGSSARGAIAALVERLPDASPVDPKVCGEDRHYWSRDIDQQTSPGEEAAAALVAIGTESLPSLVTATRAPQWVARRNAVWALGALDDARGVTPALGALADREPPVRRVAAWALGALDADVAVTALIDALRDADAGVRSQVAWALGAIRDPPGRGRIDQRPEGSGRGGTLAGGMGAGLDPRSPRQRRARGAAQGLEPESPPPGGVGARDHRTVI